MAKNPTPTSGPDAEFGSWKAVQDERTGDWSVRMRPGFNYFYEPICEVSQDGERGAAIARLIERAPALREACEALIDVVNRLTDYDDLTERILAEPERYEGFRGAVERAGDIIEGLSAEEADA